MQLSCLVMSTRLAQRSLQTTDIANYLCLCVKLSLNRQGRSMFLWAIGYWFLLRSSVEMTQVVSLGLLCWGLVCRPGGWLGHNTAESWPGVSDSLITHKACGCRLRGDDRSICFPHRRKGLCHSFTRTHTHTSIDKYAQTDRNTNSHTHALTHLRTHAHTHMQSLETILQVWTSLIALLYLLSACVNVLGSEMNSPFPLHWFSPR